MEGAKTSKPGDLVFLVQSVVQGYPDLGWAQAYKCQEAGLWPVAFRQASEADVEEAEKRDFTLALFVPQDSTSPKDLSVVIVPPPPPLLSLSDLDKYMFGLVYMLMPRWVKMGNGTWVLQAYLGSTVTEGSTADEVLRGRMSRHVSRFLAALRREKSHHCPALMHVIEKEGITFGKVLTAPGWIPVADPTEVPVPVGKGEDLVLFMNSLRGHLGLGVHAIACVRRVEGKSDAMFTCRVRREEQLAMNQVREQAGGARLLLLNTSAFAGYYD